MYGWAPDSKKGPGRVPEAEEEHVLSMSSNALFCEKLAVACAAALI